MNYYHKVLHCSSPILASEFYLLSILPVVVPLFQNLFIKHVFWAIYNHFLPGNRTWNWIEVFFEIELLYLFLQSYSTTGHLVVPFLAYQQRIYTTALVFQLLYFPAPQSPEDNNTSSLLFDGVLIRKLWRATAAFAMNFALSTWALICLWKTLTLLTRMPKMFSVISKI